MTETPIVSDVPVAAITREEALIVRYEKALSEIACLPDPINGQRTAASAQCDWLKDRAFVALNGEGVPRDHA